MKVVISQGRIV